MSFLARIQQRIALSWQEAWCGNSPQVEETGGLCSPFTGHIVGIYHNATRMTLHQVGIDTMLAAPRVRPRNSDTTTGGERTRALSVSSAKRKLPARDSSHCFLDEVERRCASRRTSRYADPRANARHGGVLQRSNKIYTSFLTFCYNFLCTLCILNINRDYNNNMKMGCF